MITKISVLRLLILSMIIFSFLWKEYETGVDFFYGANIFDDDDEMSIIVDAKEKEKKKNEHHCSIEIKIKLLFYRV